MNKKGGSSIWVFAIIVLLILFFYPQLNLGTIWGEWNPTTTYDSSTNRLYLIGPDANPWCGALRDNCQDSCQYGLNSMLNNQRRPVSNVDNKQTCEQLGLQWVDQEHLGSAYCDYGLLFDSGNYQSKVAEFTGTIGWGCASPPHDITVPVYWQKEKIYWYSDNRGCDTGSLSGCNWNVYLQLKPLSSEAPAPDVPDFGIPIQPVEPAPAPITSPPNIFIQIFNAIVNFIKSLIN